MTRPVVSSHCFLTLPPDAASKPTPNPNGISASVSALSPMLVTETTALPIRVATGSYLIIGSIALSAGIAAPEPLPNIIVTIACQKALTATEPSDANWLAVIDIAPVPVTCNARPSGDDTSLPWTTRASRPFWILMAAAPWIGSTEASETVPGMTERITIPPRWPSGARAVMSVSRSPLS